MNTPIHIPMINPNEETVRLCEWLKKQGEHVETGELIAILETSKASYELESPGPGFLHICLDGGEKYAVGTVIGKLFASIEEVNAITGNRGVNHNSSTAVLISEKAAALMKEHNICANDPELKGKRSIRTEDIQHIIDKNDKTIIPVSEHQQAVAETVTVSSTIPQAFLLKKINVSEALRQIKSFNAAHSMFSGLPELVVKAIALTVEHFPTIFSSRIDESRYRKADGAHIGITMDSGNGLFVPVIHSADKISYKKIAEQIMIFRAKSMKRNFSETDLSGGNFSISLNSEQGNIFAVPLVFPGQNAILSIGAVLKEWNDDQKRNDRYMYLGLAYDHRILNGNDASLFLDYLRKKIETGSAQLFE